MKKIALALAVVALHAACAMAAPFQTLANLDPRVAWTQTNSATDTHVTAATTSADVPYDGFVAASQFEDNYSLFAKLHFTNSTELGLIARANTATLGLYEVSFNPSYDTDGKGRLAMGRITGGAETNLTEQRYIDFSYDKDYGLKFDVNGSSLSATLYDGAKVIGSISATDATYSTGSVGFLAYKRADNVQGEWLNATISSIPEPGAIAMLIAGSLALLGWAGLRRRS